MLRCEGRSDVQRVYLDHNATTPVDPAVVEAFTKVVSLEGLPLMEIDAEMQELALPFERHFRGVEAD